ncbi:MAG: 16S rRNA (guanine(527)-N(7))-methyltransferase RsmG [Desulfomonile tiedjei]|nr:16S rRNA (guanine(527)-N(7))-methyltransferase RsmG [Desulfomonile tiedjei]
MDQPAVAKIVRHMELLVEWNDRVNLTALRNLREIAVYHFLDSLTVFKVIRRNAGLRVLDIGSGAGFPGAVLAAVDDSLRMTFLDRDPKKIVFLKILIRALNTRAASFINESIDSFISRSLKKPFDLLVSRAFSSDPGMIDAFHPLVESGGLLVYMGGPSVLAQELSLHHFEARTSWEGILPFSDRFRKVILYSRRAQPLLQKT